MGKKSAKGAGRNGCLQCLPSSQTVQTVVSLSHQVSRRFATVRSSALGNLNLKSSEFLQVVCFIIHFRRFRVIYRVSQERKFKPLWREMCLCAETSLRLRCRPTFG